MMPNVIIEGMAMPESCYDCLFARTNDDLLSDDYRYMYCDFPQIGAFVTDYIVTRHPDCPLCPAPGWISVDYNNPETLPCTEKSILYCAFGRSVGEGYYRGFDCEHHVWKMYAVAGTHWDYEVTHWMPLPEPPKGGDGK